MVTTSNSIPATLRAYVCESNGDAMQHIKLRMAEPQLPVRPDQMRIKVYAAALNLVGYKLMEVGDYLPERPSAERSSRLGFDVTGTIVETGDQVAATNAFKVGGAVYAMAYFGCSGTFAEYAVVDAKYVALKPTNISFTHAASLPLVGEISYQALVNRGKIKQGDRVLVLDGSSGTGAVGIQIAKALGAAHVTATTSTRNVELVKSFSAGCVIDYMQEQWFDVLDAHSIDLTYDCGVEPHAWNDVVQKVLKKGTGVFVTIEPKVSPDESPIGVSFYVSTCVATAVDLMALTKMVEAGELFVPIESVHPFENLLDAVRVQKSNRARGKIILQVIPDSE